MPEYIHVGLDKKLYISPIELSKLLTYFRIESGLNNADYKNRDWRIARNDVFKTSTAEGTVFNEEVYRPHILSICNDRIIVWERCS